MKFNRVSSANLSVFCSITIFSMFLMAILPSGLRAETVFFEDNFEGADLSKWSLTVPKATLTTSKSNNGSKSLRIAYDLPQGGGVHKDSNRFAQIKLLEKGIEHFFVRGCVNLSSTTPEPERPYSPTSARKMFFILGEDWNQPGMWEMIVSINGGKRGEPLGININSLWSEEDYKSYRYPINGLAIGKVKFDTWHCLELEMKLNDPGVKNAEVRLWLDGELIHERLNTSIRKDKRKLDVVRVGAQIDRLRDETARHEDRYWDDIKISDTFSSIRPKPPTH